MPDEASRGVTRREPFEISPWARWTSAILGIAGVGAGGAAVFLTHLEAGPAVLITGGVLFLLLAIGGVLPTHLKFMQAEASFRREIKDSVVRIERTVPGLEALLDAGGASLAALLAGNVPVPNKELDQADELVESVAESVAIVESKAGLDALPASALREFGRLYMAQRDWSEAARYLDAYTRSGSPSWEDYFRLGVAQMNRRGGAATDREALRAYDEAMVALPSDPPPELIPRLYSYRAAAKKRLGRLREAKVDGEIALRLAETRYEKVDATYNLAGIEAMLGNHEAAKGYIAVLSQFGAAGLVLGHLDDYFSSLRDDDEFKILVGLASP